MAEIRARARTSARAGRLRPGRFLTRFDWLITALLVFVLGTANYVWARTSTSTPTSTPTPTARVPLKKLMTVDAYDRAGLNRLTAAQRRALEIWLARHLQNMSGTLQPVPKTGASRAHQRTRSSAVSRFGCRDIIVQPCRLTRWRAASKACFADGPVPPGFI